MEKRAFAAIVLSLLVVLAWNEFVPQPEPTGQPEATDSATTETGRSGPIEDARPADDGEATTSLATGQVVAASEETTHLVETERVLVEFANRGARAVSWRLKQYRSVGDTPLELVPEIIDQQRGTFRVTLDDAGLSRQVDEALFVVEQRAVENGQRIEFRWSDGSTLEVTRAFTFRNDSYLVDIEQEVVDRGRTIESGLQVGPGFGAQEGRGGRSRIYSQSGGAIWSASGGRKTKKAKELRDGGAVDGALEWAGIDDQYFAALVIPGQRRSELNWSAEKAVVQLPGDEVDEDAEGDYQPLLSVGIAPVGGQLYVGPKKLEELSVAGQGLEESVRFYGWIRWLVQLIYKGLLWVQGNVVANWGLAIMFSTLVLRLMLFPLNQFAMIQMKKSQLEMQRIQPKIAAIKKKYSKKKDAESRAKSQQEQMDLMRAEGINPAGTALGCLPMLLQFPILIGFYNMLMVAIELRGAPFALWIRDLSLPDPFYLTPLLMGVTMFFQQRMAMTKTKDPQQLQQQRIMMFMPFVFTFFCFNAPSGLVLYWFCNNILGMGQQWLVNKQFTRVEAKVKALDTKSAKAARNA